jgi:hypothetical protein
VKPPGTARVRNVLLGIWLLVLLGGCALPVTSNAILPPSPTSSECTTQKTNEIWLPLVVTGHKFYAAPDGSPDGDGSWEHPWDLASALSGTYPVGPGDVIWLRGGTYLGAFVSRLIGSKDLPIMIRQYPGERATIDGNLTVKGTWTIYWGFEVVNSDPNQGRENGIMVFGAHTKFINLIVHDSSGSGFGVWSEAPDSEVYGSIIYNNGVDKFNHGIYLQNQVGTKDIVDNIIFNQSGLGIHGYSLPGEYLHGFHIEGNVSFNNGTLSQNGPWPNILVGGETPAERIVLLNNYTYQRTAIPGLNVDLGYETSANKDLTVKDNYFMGGSPVFHIRNWDQITLTGNTFIGLANLVDFQLPGSNDPSISQWDNNTYFADGTTTSFRFADQELTFPGWQQATNFDHNSPYVVSRPIGARIFVRPNIYEAGRAHIIVYNWDLQDTVDVDLSTVLKPGARYAIRNVQDYFGAPVAEGIYDGLPTRLPMTGIQPPRPIRSASSEPPVTGPEFNVFILTSTGSTIPSPTATTIPPASCTPISTVTPTSTLAPTNTPMPTNIAIETAAPAIDMWANTPPIR